MGGRESDRDGVGGNIERDRGRERDKQRGVRIERGRERKR